MTDQFLGMIAFCPVCGGNTRAKGFLDKEGIRQLEVWECEKCRRKFGVIKV
jgi:hypothetical protein